MHLASTQREKYSEVDVMCWWWESQSLDWAKTVQAKGLANGHLLTIGLHTKTCLCGADLFVEGCDIRIPNKRLGSLM